MAQSLLQPSEITAIPLAVAHTNIKFAKAVDRSYGTLFGNSGVSLSGKAGQTIQIRLPNKYTVRRGSAVAIQAQNEQSVALTVASEIGVDSQFLDIEETLLVDDWFKRYGEPMGLTMGTTEDSDGSALAYQIHNSYLLDTTSATTGQKSLLSLKQQLVEANIPIGSDINLVIPAMAETQLAALYTNNFNPASTISSIVKEGVMSGVAGVNWYMDQTMPNITTGTRTNGTCATTVSAEGASTIALTGLGNAGTVVVGEVFTVAGCYTVNPETKLSTGNLQRFVVLPQVSSTAGSGTFAANATNAALGVYTASAGGAVTVTVSPVMYSSVSLGLQNISAFPTSSKTATFLGAASTTYGQCVMMHKTGIALAHVELEKVGGMEMYSNSKIDGMTLRYIRGYDITNGRKISRYDSLYGWAMIRPEWTGKLWVPFS